MLHDHTDLRVSNIAKVRPLYDALLPALGYTRVTSHEDLYLDYHLPGEDVDFLGLTADPEHRPNGTRIAFAADSREQVDALAELARTAGAGAIEPPHLCSEYAENYYATFLKTRTATARNLRETLAAPPLPRRCVLAPFLQRTQIAQRPRTLT